MYKITGAVNVKISNINRDASNVLYLLLSDRYHNILLSIERHNILSENYYYYYNHHHRHHRIPLRITDSWPNIAQWYTVYLLPRYGYIIVEDDGCAIITTIIILALVRRRLNKNFYEMYYKYFVSQTIYEATTTKQLLPATIYILLRKRKKNIWNSKILNYDIANIIPTKNIHHP